MTQPEDDLRGTGDQEVEQLPTGTVLGEPDPGAGAGDDDANAVDEAPVQDREG